MNDTVISNITEGSKPKKKKSSWAKDLTNGEQMYNMGVVNQKDLDIEDLDNDNINDYKKVSQECHQATQEMRYYSYYAIAVQETVTKLHQQSVWHNIRLEKVKNR